ncbi:hypothetical protein NDI52_28590 [Leptolyngbya sp. PL-A3]|uniref:hypothetical protein n=1 Tax=Leptolyngbya sp. PL-A3 TaxID=2933911 RepID=UPI00329A37C5
MENDQSAYVLVDASPLISFLKIGRFDLLGIFNIPLACTDFVRAEVRRPRESLENLIISQQIKEIPLVDPTHLLEVEKLRAEGLGRGEASSIVLAQDHAYRLILDDKRARKKALKMNVTPYSTVDVIVCNIQARKLTLQEADSFIFEWKALGEFPVSCKSFQEFLP